MLERQLTFDERYMLKKQNKTKQQQSTQWNYVPQKTPGTSANLSMFLISGHPEVSGISRHRDCCVPKSSEVEGETCQRQECAWSPWHGAAIARCPCSPEERERTWGWDQAKTNKELIETPTRNERGEREW